MLETLNSFFTCYDCPEEINEYIPDSFWNDKNRVLAAIRIVLDDRTNRSFNTWEFLPSRVLNDKEVVLELAEYAPTSVLSNSIPEEFKKDKEIVFTVLDGLVELIEESYNNYPALPWDRREHLELFFEDVSTSLKSDKDFILRFIEDYTYFDNEFDLLFDWTDEELWSDKDFVKKVLDKVWKDERVISHLSDDMLSDKEIKELLE